MEADKEAKFKFWKETLKSARYVVAPMVDQSELAWRLLARQYAADLCYTPMYHAAVFVRDAIYRRDALQTAEEDRPLIMQFCANDPQTLLKAARYAEGHCEAVDLNLGCPQSIARRGHYGAYLQDEWDLLREMVSLCAKELRIPITCKIRVFDDIGKTVRYAQMLENAGCKLLTVHGRTIVQKGALTSLASWAHIAAVRKNVNIPVFANGNIQSLDDVHRCLAHTAVQGVMSAEGHLHNPALFTGQELPVWQLAEEYLAIVRKYPCHMSFVRGHLFKLFHHVLHAHQDLREVLGNNCKTVDDACRLTQTVKHRCQPDVDKYEADPAAWQSHLPMPYWICQPYIRPSPGEPTEGKSEKDARLKRSLHNILSGDTSTLSKNKLKKLRRFPKKSFQAKEKKFIICPCGHPRGLKCVFDVCKVCCRKQSWLEKKDCAGHRFIIRNRIETEARRAAGNSCASTDSPTEAPPGQTDVPRDAVSDTVRSLVDGVVCGQTAPAADSSKCCDEVDMASSAGAGDETCIAVDSGATC